MTKIVGVTFPILKQFIDRFFKDGKDVFIKPATCFKELKSGMKFVFYQSHEDTLEKPRSKRLNSLMIR